MSASAVVGAAGRATAAAAASSTSASVGTIAPVTLSGHVRTVLLSGGNVPVRLNALWDAVKARAPELAKSKSHFSKGIVGNMLAREELMKEKFTEGMSRDRTRVVYGYRLKGSGRVKRIVRASLGLEVDWTRVRELGGVGASSAGGGSAAAGTAAGAVSAPQMR